jgi:hypothetical protein
VDTTSSVTWRKSSYSGGSGSECVEVGSWRKSSYSGGPNSECLEAGVAGHGYVLVRDTKDQDGATLAFTADAWAAFTGGLR